MKTMRLKFNVTMLILAAVLVTVSSCKKSDEGPSNYFSVDGSANGTKTLLFSYDDAPGESASGKASYTNEVDFLSDGFTLTGSDVTAGKGSALVLEFYGASNSLDAGTYTFTGSEDTQEPYEIFSASYALNFDVANPLSADVVDITSGTMVVTKTGSTYTINVDAKAGAKVIVGKYTGTIVSGVSSN